VTHSERTRDVLRTILACAKASVEEVQHALKLAMDEIPEGERPYWLVGHLQRAEYGCEQAVDFLKKCVAGEQDDHPLHIPD
jgi:predicted RecA/RadA family phage recombinase